MAIVRRILVSMPLVLTVSLGAPRACRSADPEALDALQFAVARQAACASPGYINLHKIGLALHGYHDIFRRFPPAVLTGPDGETKYSWRVELLPVLKYYVEGVKPDRLREFAINMTEQEQRALYWELIQESGYRLNEAWDSSHNEALLKSAPAVYRHPLDEADSIYTSYFGLTGSGTVFAGPQGTTTGEITDGPGSTLMLVEAVRQVPWTLPEDIDIAADKPLPQFGRIENGRTDAMGFLVLTCDGAVHFLPHGTPEADFRALITPAAKDAFSIPWIPYRYNRNRRFGF